MSIRVLLFASLADIAGLREIALEPGGLADIESVFERLAADFPALGPYRSVVLCARNREFADRKAPVLDGDEIALFPPVSGG